jgi:S1-C subfamily serine protease
MIVLVGAGADASAASEEYRDTTVPVAAPIDTDSAGKARNIAMKSVVRVVCPKENWSGSGFLHKSGKVITAEHVVHPCSEIFIIPNSGAEIPVSIVATDVDLDLGLLAPNSPISEAALPISARLSFNVGTQVATWGFPAGYPGRDPLLSVGYLAGMAAARIDRRDIAPEALRHLLPLGLGQSGPG